MPSPMQNAVMTHWRALSAASGVTVTYQKTASTSLILTMVPGRSTAENEYDDGRIFSEKSQDWIVPYSSLSFLPEIGHRIIHGTKEYEVLALGLSRHYQWADHFETLLRIHTKHVAPDVIPLTDWEWQDDSLHINQAGDQMEFQEAL